MAEKGRVSTPNIVPYKEKRTRGKGLKRTQKQWEETITRHIGQILDNTKVSDIANLLPMALCGYYGYQNFKGAPEWAAAGIIGYKLATSDNVVSAGAGLGILGTIGISGLWNLRLEDPLNEVTGGREWEQPTYPEDDFTFKNPQCREGFTPKWVVVGSITSPERGYWVCVKNG